MDPQPNLNPQEKKEPAIDMEVFREEIAALVVARGNMKRETDMNLQDLTEEDAKMWNRIKSYTKGSITREEFKLYQKDARDSGVPARITLAGGIISNTLTGIWGEEELKELEEMDRLDKERTKEEKN